MNPNQTEKAVKKKEQTAAIMKKVYRYLGIIVAKILLKTKIKPNHITIFRTIIILPLTGYFFYLGSHSNIIIGAILLQISMILDYADGSLARIRNMTSKIGAWLDHIGDAFSYPISIGGTTLGIYFLTNQWYILPLGILAISAALTRRIIYAYFTKTYTFSEDILEEQKSKYKFLKNFFYEGPFIVMLLTVGAIVNQMYYVIILFAIMGWLYVFTLSYKLGKKLNFHTRLEELKADKSIS